MNKKERLYDLKKLYGLEQADGNFINDIITVFLNNIPVESKELVKSCTEKNWEKVYFISHKLKANIELLNIESIKGEIRAVERYAKIRTHLEERLTVTRCVVPSSSVM